MLSNQFLFSLIKKFKTQYITLFVFSAVINFLMLAPAWYMLQVYDRVLTSFDDNTLLGLSLIVIFLYFVYAFLERYRGLILIGISEVLDQNIAPELHEAVLRPSIKDRHKELNGLNDLNIVKQFLTGQPILAILDSPWILIYLGAIFLLHTSLGLVATLSALLLFCLAVINQRLVEGNLSKAQKANISERKLVSNILSASDSIQTMGMRVPLIGSLGQVRSDYLNNFLGASMASVSLSSVTKFLRVLIQSIALGYGAYLAIHNEVSAGMIIAGSILLGRTLAPIEGIIQSWRQLSEFRKSYANLDEILKADPKYDHSVNLERPRGWLQLINVTVRLREHGKPTLDKINLEIKDSECVALIGPSGAGKTSLLKTLCGIYKPQNGQVIIDGSDLMFRDFDALGQHFGYLAQTTELLAGKVSENISRFLEVDSSAVLKAAKLSGAHEMITALPEGYETILGDRGYGLSEGQKRKIGLARALYGDPAIVFMDEPGAGLDDVSLASVVNVIKHLKQQRVTVVFATHQPILVHLADKVAVMVNGKIQFLGSNAELISRLKRKATKHEEK